MFLVRDTSAAREARIQGFLSDDPSLAALLAIVHVEWTLRRAIIALGSSPNVVVREQLRQCHGHENYRDVWRDEVLPRTGQRLTGVIQNWDGLKRTFRLRHVLVHGVRPVSFDYAAERAGWALAGAADIRALCTAHGIDIDSRLPVRRRQ
jgi:hypothetical protein